jgi:hypothetical protein
MGYFLNSRIDRCDAIFGPVWAPAPANHVGPQKLTLLVKEGKLRGRRGVVVLERLIAGIVDQCVGDAERRDEVVNAPVL